MEKTNKPSGSRSPAGTRKLRARILIVEDEFLLAALLEDDLRSLGYSVGGPHTTLAQAMEASRREPFDLAILDINLRGEMVYPLADELLSRKIPFLFLSGYGLAELPERFRTVPRMSKPHELIALQREIERLLADFGLTRQAAH